MGLFRGAVFHHGGVHENCPLALIMGRFPSLMGRFPTFMGRFPEGLNGPFSLLKIPLKTLRTPRYGSGPKCRLHGPPPPPLTIEGPLPHTSLGRTLPEHCKKSQGGWGEEGGGGWVGTGCGQGSVLQLQWGGWGGDPPNGSWSQTHIWGLLKTAH